MSASEFLGDAAVLWRLLRGLPRSGNAAERLQRFYAPQASRYDTFRSRLLHGRDELIGQLPAGPGEIVVELGGGTGANLERFAERLPVLGRVILVDLCPALLEQARRRVAGRANVELVEADMTRYRPPQPVDCVYLSYALTMVEDWRAVIANALEMLRPGGTLGVVDFYVSGAQPMANRVHHRAWERGFWRRWFAHDGVRLDPGHLMTLTDALPDFHLMERRGRVPYLPGLSAPYYVFTGRKP